MSDVSLLELLPRLFLSMAIVIVVMYVAARVMKNRNVSMTGNHLAIGAKNARKVKAPLVEVLGRQGVGKNASVSVVRTGGKTLVLGITDTNVTLLTELDLTVEDESAGSADGTEAPRLLSVPPLTNPEPSGDVFKNILDQVRERTVRRLG